MELPKMRTIKQAYKELKNLDKNTAVTEYYIRSIVKQRLIPVICAGNKQLVNFDTLCEYLNNQIEVDASCNTGNIRPQY